jgi:hypothetical protein
MAGLGFRRLREWAGSPLVRRRRRGDLALAPNKAERFLRFHYYDAAKKTNNRSPSGWWGRGRCRVLGRMPRRMDGSSQGEVVGYAAAVNVGGGESPQLWSSTRSVRIERRGVAVQPFTVSAPG